MELESLPPPSLGDRSTSLETRTSSPRRRYPSGVEVVAPSKPSPLRRTRETSSSESSHAPDYEHSTGFDSATAPQMPPVHRVSEVDHLALVSNLDGVQQQGPEEPARGRILDGSAEAVDDIDKLIAELEAVDGGGNPGEETNKGADENRVPNQVPDHWLNTDIERGLTTTQANSRRKTSGFNELKVEKEKNLFFQFFLFFRGPIQFVMLCVVILAAILRDWIEMGIIGGLLIFNAIVGLLQDRHANSVVDALRRTLKNTALVLRDGRLQEIETRMIVPGDLIKLEEGTVLPADGRIVTENVRLQIDQSAMTGESLPQSKGYGDACFSSSLVKRGAALMVVTVIGDDTKMGRMALLVNKASAGKGDFRRIINNIGIALLGTVLATSCVVWSAGFYRSRGIAPILKQNLAILIIGVPVGLPIVVTTTLAVGAQFLSKKQAIVQRLSAIESLAGVEILCSDKTGTLTKNQLTMGEPYTVGQSTGDKLVLVACLAASHKVKGMDPIDKAFVRALSQYTEAKETIKLCKIIDFTPFDPVSKKAMAVCDVPEGGWTIRMTCVKGAPRTILEWVASHRPIPADMRKKYEAKVEELASRGFRALGVAAKRGDDPWELLGIMPCFDPPRHDTAATINEAKELGLRIKMLTGDAMGIARETSRQLGLGTNIFNADKLGVAGTGIMSESERGEFVEAADGFAEVFPEHKNEVVGIFQQRGYLVAMTGDGVNDAPALKKADVGIAVEGASEAARSAADIIFKAPGLSAVIDALKTSRQIFHRMYAYLVFRIALSIHQEIFLGIWIAVFDQTLPSELVTFTAVFADIATIAIAYDNAAYSMTPDKWNLPRIWGIAVALGLVLGASTWVCLSYMIIGSEDGGIVQIAGSRDAILFLEIVLTQNWLIFITRAKGNFWYNKPSWQLICSVLFVDTLATVMALFGWFVGNSRTHFFTILRVWIFSFGVFWVLAFVYYLLHNNEHFDNFVAGRWRHKRYITVEGHTSRLERVTAGDHRQDGQSIPQNRSRARNFSQVDGVVDIAAAACAGGSEKGYGEEGGQVRG